MVARANYTRRRRGRRHAASTRENRSRSATRPPMPPNRTSSYASWPVKHRRAQDCGLAPQRSRERACRRRRACASVGCEGGCGREAQWRVAWQQMACSGEGEGHTRLLEKLRVECRSQPPQQLAHFTCGCGSVGGQPSVRAAGSENRVRNQNDEAGWQVCTRGPWTNMSTALPLGRAGGVCAHGRRQREHPRCCICSSDRPCQASRCACDLRFASFDDQLPFLLQLG